jgi:hypothetical protein
LDLNTGEGIKRLRSLALGGERLLIAVAAASLLIQVMDVLPFAVIQLLITESIAIELVEECLNALLHIHRFLLWLMLDQRRDAGLERLQSLPAPGLQKMPAAFETFLPLQQSGRADPVLQAPEGASVVTSVHCSRAEADR